MSLHTILAGVLGTVVAAGAPVVGRGAGHACAQGCDPVEVAKLLADDGDEEDLFGYSVAIDNDTAVVGAIGASDNAWFSGSAYVFTRSAGVWTQQAELLPDDGGYRDEFGYSVAIDGDTAVIGAVWDDDHGDNAGSAYVFVRDDNVWTQQAKLVADDPGGQDHFGRSVSLSGDTVFIGADLNDDLGRDSGCVYVFTRSGGVWTQLAKLLPDDGAPNDQFGHSVSLSGDTAVIGAYWNDHNGHDSGSAYVFTRSGGVWIQQAKLAPNDGGAGDWFGYSVSLSGDTAVIGADRDGVNYILSGSAYVFTRSGGVWTQQAKLVPDDGSHYDQFGHSVSLSGDTALIEAYWDDDNGTDSGSVYVFTRSGVEWSQRAKLLASDGAPGDVFGWSVSVSGPAALIGAAWDDDKGDASGSVYAFDLECEECPADLNGDGVVDTLDFLAFLGAWSAGDALADWNRDGVVNSLDVLAYLIDWSAGCAKATALVEP